MRAPDSDARHLEIAVLLDSPDENWPSMDLVGEMLLEQWAKTSSYQVTPSRLSVRIPPLVRRLPGVRHGGLALNADRALARYLAYPVRAALARKRSQFFHVVDHSYAHLVHVLPASRTGVYCHDLDVLGPLLDPGASRSRPTWRVVLARLLAAGLRSAAVVFHSTQSVGRALRAHDLVASSRLVYAPYGVAPEFHPGRDPNDDADRLLASLDGRPFVLHVGSGIRRKRLDVAFEVVAALRAKWPALQFVQQGATLSPAQREHVDALGLGDVLLQPPKVDRATLAGLYRRAAAVILTSEAEGFGLPVIEALACGAAVVASDIPVLREVGGDAVLYAPVGDVPSWATLLDAVLSRAPGVPSKADRLARASTFTWGSYARTILEAYRHMQG